jgi:putative oxidoreductase
MIRSLLQTTDDRAALVARLTLALVMFPHGMQKLAGWFGGHGFDATLGAFTQQLGIPAAVAVLAILVEGLAPVALALGLLGRAAALGIVGVMIGAAVIVHAPNGFFMNWNGTAAGEGFEFHLLAIALALVVVIRGSGAFSLDLALQRRALPRLRRQPALSNA